MSSFLNNFTKVFSFLSKPSADTNNKQHQQQTYLEFQHEWDNVKSQPLEKVKEFIETNKDKFDRIENTRVYKEAKQIKFDSIISETTESNSQD